MFFPYRYRKTLLSACVLVLLIGVGLFISQPLNNWISTDRYSDEPERDYQEIYRLTSPSVSKSAPITVTLPEGVNQEDGIAHVQFEPPLEGNWTALSIDAQKIAFSPKEPLPVGSVYLASLETDYGTFSQDFVIKEDPAIVAVFPNNESETHEDSEITIVFNRPMVPITTLDTTEKRDIPVTIAPETPGRFKWIGTQTLQFLPETDLIRSSNYSVSIDENFASLEGLTLTESKTHNFTTRKLRFTSASTSEKHVYNRPIVFHFNQAVDLKETQKNIQAFKVLNDANEPIEFIAQYHTKTVYDHETDSYKTETDESAIAIYQKEDLHKRPKFWDFEERYTVEISEVVPLEGDIYLQELLSTTVEVTDAIESTTAQSDRSDHVTTDFFDPQGTISVQFFEEIDLDKTRINAPSIESIAYNKKCNTNEEDEYTSVSESYCEKVDDYQSIVIDFKDDEIKRNGFFDLEFEKIINREGQQINPKILKRSVLVIREFEVLKTIPSDNDQKASITEAVFCTTTPLIKPSSEENDGYELIKSEQNFEYWYWEHSHKIWSEGDNELCPKNSFLTRLNYGLAPNQNYTMSFTLNEQFGESQEVTLSFQTGDMPYEDLYLDRLHDFYSVTTPDKTKLAFMAKNLDTVELHICKMGAQKAATLTYQEYDYNVNPQNMRFCSETIKETIPLEKKYWLKKYFYVDIAQYFDDPLGHYMVTLWNPRLLDDIENSVHYNRSLVSVTNIGVVQKNTDLNNATWLTEEDKLSAEQAKDISNLIWVTDLTTLAPIDKAQVEIFRTETDDWNDYIYKSAGTYETDRNGIARTPATSNTQAAIVRNGPDSAIVTSESYIRYSYGEAMRNNHVYLYSDRPIYKPGDTVYIKGIERSGYDGTYEYTEGKEIEAYVYNSEYEEVLRKNVALNAFGSFELEFVIDQEAPLGTFEVNAGSGFYSFDVLEYEPAAFEVKAIPEKEEYISQETINIDVDANYYFGAPVEGGSVYYNVSSQNYYFDKYTDEYFSFGSPWYRCYWNCYYSDQFLMSKRINLNEDGSARISETLDLSELFTEEDEQSSKILVFNITVENSSGQSISTQQSMIVHWADYYIGMNSNTPYVGQNESFQLRAKTVDTNGEPLKVRNLDMSVNKVEWVRNKRQEVDGAFYYRSEKVLEKVIEKTISTDGDGNWSDEVSLEDNGEYEVIIRGTDSEGRTVKSVYTLYVWGTGYASIRPSNNTDLELVSNAADGNLNVGDTASFIIKSPFEKAKALISIERGSIYDYEIVDVNQSLFEYEFEITDRHIPNVFASVVLISDDPEVKHGEVQYQINTDHKDLQVEVQPNKDHYLPGEEVTLDFTVTNHAGIGQKTELSVAVVDKSVLALKGNPQKNPVTFFYNSFPLTVQTNSNLKNILEEVDILAKTKGGGGGPGLDTKARGEFKDTAFWEGTLLTDADGKAQITFTLADNLTTWQVESLGITKDHLIGVGYQDFMSRKDVMLTPLKPRFVVPGDEFSIGAKVFNQTDSALSLDVAFESETLIAQNENTTRSIRIPAKETQTVYFKTYAPENIQNGQHSFTLAATNNDYNDTVIQNISITRNDTYEVTATSNFSNNNTLQEFVYLPENIVEDKGALTVNTSATLAVFLSDALNYFVEYPYGCTEQIVSKLGSMAILKKGLSLENIGSQIDLKNIQFDGKTYNLDQVIQLGLSRIGQNQQYDGGFAYYNYLESDYYLTLHTLQTLQTIREAGYEVNDEQFNKALSYINAQISSNADLYKHTPTVVNTVMILDRIQGIQAINTSLLETLRTTVFQDPAYIRETISNAELVQLAVFLGRNMSQKANYFGQNNIDTVFDTLENRIDIDARGAYLRTSQNRFWRTHETAVQNTALMMQAFIARAQSNNSTATLPITDKILRWILNSRSKDGAWSTTSNTITVIDTFTQYLSWQKENESDFTLSVLYDGEQKANYTFANETVTDQNTVTLPIADLAKGKLSTLVFKKENNNELNNNLYYDIGLKYYLPMNSIPPRDEGFSITREWYKVDDTKLSTPVTQAQVGDVLRGKITIIVPEERNFVAIEDFIPAGTELVNFRLETSDRSLLDQEQEIMSRKLYVDREEVRNDRLFLFKEWLSPGTYEYDYFVRVLTPGKFHHLPAIISEMYFPENFARTRGDFFIINEN